MANLGWVIFFAALLGGPLVSVIWLLISWSRYKETVPFTPEHSKMKKRLTIAAIIAGIMVSIYIIIMAIYGVKVYFA